MRAFFKGNGTNVVKIAPETAIKLTLNDALKRVGHAALPQLRGATAASTRSAAACGRAGGVQGWACQGSAVPRQPSPLNSAPLFPAWPVQVVTPDPDEITPAQRMTAGALAGACAQATIYPFELVRARRCSCPVLAAGAAHAGRLGSLELSAVARW